MGNPYQAVIDEHVENIASLYARFEEKRPVMLLDIQSQEIYAYPFDEYKKELNTRDQRFLEEHRGRVSSGKVMVVFVRDHEARKLVSYQFERTRG